MFLFTMEIKDNSEIDLLKKLYEREASKMYSIALSILKNSNSAEDAVHDAFISIVKNLKRYNDLSVEELEALCVVITKNKCLDQIRKERKIMLSDMEEIRFPTKIHDDSPEEQFVRKERNNYIWKIINDLPEIYKEIIILRYYYNFGIKKIARLLDEPIKTIDSRLYRAKKMVRRILEDEEKRD